VLLKCGEVRCVALLLLLLVVVDRGVGVLVVYLLCSIFFFGRGEARELCLNLVLRVWFLQHF